MTAQEISIEIDNLNKEIKEVQKRISTTEEISAIRYNAKRLLYLTKGIKLREKLLNSL